jgi:hypothetical protein
LRLGPWGLVLFLVKFPNYNGPWGASLYAQITQGTLVLIVLVDTRIIPLRSKDVHRADFYTSTALGNAYTSGKINFNLDEFTHDCAFSPWSDGVLEDWSTGQAMRKNIFVSRKPLLQHSATPLLHVS